MFDHSKLFNAPNISLLRRVQGTYYSAFWVLCVPIVRMVHEVEVADEVAVLGMRNCYCVTNRQPLHMNM